MNCEGCIQGFLAWVRSRNERQRTVPNATLSDALAALIASKRSSNRRPRYVRGLELYVLQFIAGRESDPVASVTTEDVERWFRERRESPCVMRGNLGRLGSFFSFACRRGWIERNPVARVERPRVEVPEPFILTVDQCRRLVAAIRADRPDLMPPLVLVLFCGLRPAVDLERGVIRVDRTKTGKRRIVPLEPSARAWLAVCDRSIALCPSWSTVRRRRRELRPDWPQDILRHTAASYLLALHQDAGKVAFWLGNSPRILMQHYSELVSVDDCKAFWELQP